ncbi:MAG: PAS domain-containing protein [Hymenobacter sp.]|nr:MAG: PAS domain-containing protein [Hymenobacter sp.]
MTISDFTAFERLQTAVDAAGVGTWDYDLVADTLTWSPRCKELFGVPAEASVTYADFVELLHPDDRAATVAAVEQALDPAGPGSYDIEYRTRWQDARTEPCVARATGRAFFNEARTQAVRFIGTITDITAQRRTQEQLERAYQDLEVKVTFRNLELEHEVQRLRALLAAAENAIPGSANR